MNVFPANERERLKALEKYKILDTLPEKQYDDITRLASIICETPIAIISLLGKDRQWFKSRIGVELGETERCVSFCQYAILEDNVLEINDAFEHTIFKENPFVLNSPFIRFYAGTPLTTSDGYKLGSLCVIDIAPKELSNEQREALEILGRQVVSLLELRLKQMELAKAKEEAEKASLAKAEFLANMSHEIRTPLNSILGFSEILKSEDLSLEVKNEFLNNILTSGKTLNRLIGDILDLNKIEAGKEELFEDSFNLVELIKSSIEPYKFSAKGKGLSLKILLDDELPEWVLGDAKKISQVLVNLVGNAIKFTKEGEIRVKIEKTSLDTASEINIKFLVSDTGVGIPISSREEVFESFTQANQSIHKEFGGFGLGLTIVKKLVDIMKGDINIISPSNETAKGGPGSTFEVFLNLKVDAKNDRTIICEENLLLPFDKEFKILVAEDNLLNQKLVEIILIKFNCICNFAFNGNEAVELIQKNKYDLVLMDIQMPTMDGYTATRIIREELKMLDIPIIGLTARVFKDDIQECLNVGMQGHLGKPFTQHQIYEVLKKYCKD